MTDKSIECRRHVELEATLRLALEALDSIERHGGGSCWVLNPDLIEAAIVDIKEALMSVPDGTQPAVAEQHKQSTTCGEPVAWCSQFEHSCVQPPRLAPLTDEQIKDCLDAADQMYCERDGDKEVFKARAIEAAHGIRPSDFKEKDIVIKMPAYLNASYEGDDLFTGDQVRELVNTISNPEQSTTCGEPCPDKERDEYACKNRHQCWAPCGELGKSEEHAQPKEPEQRSVSEHLEPVANPFEDKSVISSLSWAAGLIEQAYRASGGHNGADSWLMNYADKQGERIRQADHREWEKVNGRWQVKVTPPQRKEQEPFAYVNAQSIRLLKEPTASGFIVAHLTRNKHDPIRGEQVAIYTTPPPVGFAVMQKPWRRLTDEDLANCDDTELKQALYWEQILKEKNT